MSKKNTAKAAPAVSPAAAIPGAAKISGTDQPLEEAMKPVPENKPKRAATGAAAKSAAAKAKKEAEAAEAAKAAFVIFESREKEPRPFDIASYRPERHFASGRLIWRVEADDVKRFERHHHVQRGRVRRAPDGTYD